jgi:hypothetical protein
MVRVESNMIVVVHYIAQTTFGIQHFNILVDVIKKILAFFALKQRIVCWLFLFVLSIHHHIFGILVY